MMRSLFRLRRYDDKVRILLLFFVVASMAFMVRVHAISAQSITNLQEQIIKVRETATEAAQNTLLINAQVARNTEDIKTLTQVSIGQAALLNQISGIGMTIVGIGILVGILQAVGIKQNRKTA